MYTALILMTPPPATYHAVRTFAPIARGGANVRHDRQTPTPPTASAPAAVPPRTAAAGRSPRARPERLNARHVYARGHTPHMSKLFSWF